jgi:hypothetical protein
LKRFWNSGRAKSEPDFLDKSLGNGRIDDKMTLNKTPTKLLVIFDIIPINLFASN